MTAFFHTIAQRRLTALLLCLGLVAGCGAPEGMPDFDASTAAAHKDSPTSVPEPAVEMADAMVSAVAPTPIVGPMSESPNPAFVRSGVVTAGDIDDALNLPAFKRYQARTSKELGLPRANLLTPVQVQMVGRDDRPAPGVPYSLRKPGAAEPFHTGYSGVDGRITVFPASLGAARQSKVELRAYENGQKVLQETISTGGFHRVTVPATQGWTPDFLDLVFVFDTTGSMGDELAWLTKEFSSIIRQATTDGGAVFVFGGCGLAP